MRLRLIFRPVLLYSLRVDHEHPSGLEHSNFAQQEVGPIVHVSRTRGGTASVVQELSADHGHVIYLRELDIRSHDQPHREQVQPIRAPF